MTLAELAVHAAVGTNQRPFSPDHVPALAGRLAADADLLDAAGYYTTARRLRAPRAERVPVAHPAPPEVLPEAPPGFVSVFSRALGEQRVDVLAEALGALAGHGLRLPARLVPAVLDLAATRRSLGTLPTAALGECGRWLCSLNPDWTRAAAAATAEGPLDDDAWTFGTPAQRGAWLRRRRRDAPDEAREALAATWGSDSAQAREELVRCLEIGLGISDEAFLSRAAGDRSARVAAAARDLLLVLDDSALRGRLVAAAAGSVVRPTGLLRRCPELRAPAVDASLAADLGLGKDRDELTVLNALVGSLPPAVWPRLIGAPATQLLAVSLRRVEQALRPGLRTAALRWRDAELAGALLSATLDAELLAVLPPDSRAAAIAGRAGDPAALAAALPSAPRPWPAELTGTVLGVLEGQVKKGWSDPQLWEALGLGAAPGDATRVTARIRRIQEGADRQVRAAATAITVLNLRHLLSESLS